MSWPSRPTPEVKAIRQALKVSLRGLPAHESGRSILYLTFDDGPHPLGTPSVLRVLAQYQAHATFFVVGARARRNPDLIWDTYSDGHVVANHCLTHSTLRNATAADFRYSITGCDDAIKAGGATPARLLRPPFGTIDINTVLWAAALDKKVVLWDLDTHDWQTSSTPPTILRELMPKLFPGAVVLMHDGKRPNVAAETLSYLLPALSSQGWVFHVLDDSYLC